MNNLELILEELAGKNIMSIYHDGGKKVIEQMKKDDFNPGIFGSGKKYGAGFYSVWKKEDANKYGQRLFKGYVNLSTSKILVLDPAFYKEEKKSITKNYIKEQLENEGIYTDLEIPYIERGLIFYKEKETPLDKFYSSDFLEDLYKSNKKIATIFDGVAYRGKTDGHCLLMWNYHKVIITKSYEHSKRMFGGVGNNKGKMVPNAFSSQKKKLFNNFAIYNENGIKIVERNRNYIFFHNGKNIFSFSREQKKESSDTLSDYKTLTQIMKVNNIPKWVLSQMTFSDGSKITQATSKSIVRRRASKKDENMDKDIDFRSDLEDGSLFEKINRYSRFVETSLTARKYFYNLQSSELPYNFWRNVEKKINEGRKTIIICHFGILPKKIEENKNLVYDLQGKTELDFRGVRETNFKFNGTFTGFKRRIIINYNDIDYIQLSYNRTLDSLFKNCEVLITHYNGSSIRGLEKCIFVNPQISNISNKRNNMILRYIKEFPSSYDREEEINFEKINFGKSKKNWVFPAEVKKIFYNKVLDKNSVKELKARNKKIVFIKEGNDG